MQASWATAFWKEGCDRKVQPEVEDGPAVKEYPPPEPHGYLQQAGLGLSAKQFWHRLLGPPPEVEEIPVY
eukprot:1110054-Alexandrium_andersonii.AAC.1